MNKRITAYARAFGVVGAMSVLAAGATYAVGLQSNVTLTGNTLATTNADLLIYDGATYAETATGFTVSGLVPGVESDPYPFFFKNNGGVPLSVAAIVENPYVFNGFDSTSETTNGNKVLVRITDEESGDVLETTLHAFQATDGVTLPGDGLESGATGNGGVPGTEGNFSITFEIQPDAVEGSEQASIDAFDVKFAGTQVLPPAPVVPLGE